jgi:2-oxoglutarate ferredoxin oxidoreductase subunit alpha
MLRLIVCWPFPENKIKALAEDGKAMVVAEMNYGQLFFEAERLAYGKVPVLLAGHGGGTVHNAEDIAKLIVEAHKCRS